MTDTTISLRIDREVYERMRSHDEINWSSFVRKSIAQKLMQLEHIDFERAKKAAKVMDEIRKTTNFSKGKSGTEIIREWRAKRK